MIDNEPETEWLIQYTPPVDRHELDQVQDMLRAHQPFVSGVFFNDPYEVVSYLPRQLIWGEEYCLLVDRNVVTRWTRLVRGHVPLDHDRLAAAAMLFAQAADLLIEPGIAFYEITGIATPAEINQELEEFYIAQDAEPQTWADVALRHSDTLALQPGEIRPPRKDVDLSVPLYMWRRSYVLALKIAELHLLGGRPEYLMMRFLEWMYNDFLLGGVAVQLASYYFAPGSRRKRLLKSIESPDRKRALKGIRNAAWDLTLISEWLRRVKRSMADASSKQCWILCTFDESLRQMAQGAVSFDEYQNDLGLLEQTFAKVWNSEAAARLATILHRYQSDLGNPLRQVNHDPKGDEIDRLIELGEQTILEWKPRGGSA